MPTKPLRLVPRPRAWRPSIIVDIGRDPPQPMTPPLDRAQHDAMQGGPIPHQVFVGMWIAAWARAELCPLNIAHGYLEPHCRRTPSDELYAAVGQCMATVAGVLGFGVPLQLDEHKRAYAATWRFFWENN